MADPLPIDCSLNAGDYAARLAEIREVGEVAFVRSEVHRDGPGADLYFRNSADIDRRLREIVQAEAACCAFLDLRLDSVDGSLRLSILGPADAEPVVQDLVQSFESGRTNL